MSEKLVFSSLLSEKIKKIILSQNLQHTLEIEKKHQFSSHLYVDRKAKFLTMSM